MAAQTKTTVQPVIVRGSLITLKRKCGKPNCACVDGEPHETPALSYSLEGRTKMVTLRKEDIARVKRALRAYQRAANQLEQEAIKGIRQLRHEIRRNRTQRKAR